MIPNSTAPAPPLVSILLPARNEEALLARSVNSIFTQTCRSWEIIAVNDGSQDHTQDILHSWQSRLGTQRLRIITNNVSQGLSASLNAAIAAATSPLLARLDADDWWTPDKLARQVTWLNTHPNYGIVGSYYHNHGPTWNQLVRLPSTDVDIRRTIYQRNPFGHSCVLMRTAVVRAAGGYDERVAFGQDWELWFRLLKQTKLHNLPVALCHRTVREPSPGKRFGQLRQAVRTVTTYTRLHQASPLNLLYLAEPVAAACVPRWAKRLVYTIRS